MLARSPVPSAKDGCTKCGAHPVRILVGEKYLCEEHRLEWLQKETDAAEFNDADEIKVPPFTPGPWEARNVGFRRDELVVGSPNRGRHYTLARVLRPVGDPLRKTIANARLMAAAPDLLSAVEMWLFYLTLDAPGSLQTEELMLKKMRLAVAKARGEQVPE